MNASKLKAIFTTACCFVVALCSEIKSMDTASDLQETPSFKARETNSEGCLDSLKKEIGSNASRSQFLHNQDENKGPKTSWATYITEPVKAVIHGTYNIVDFTVKHPTQSLITSLLITAQFTAVAAQCNCLWNCQEAMGLSVVYRMRTLGTLANAAQCKHIQDPQATICDYYGCL